MRSKSRTPIAHTYGPFQRSVLCGLWLAAVAAAAWASPSWAAPEGAAPAGRQPKYAAVKDALAAQGVDFSYEIYQVQAGDTVANIAARFGVRASAIRQFNGLGDRDLAEGEAIAIPLSARPAPKPRYREALNLIEPCYALVTQPCAITLEPAQPTATQVLYESGVGAQLIVNAEHGEYFGVVMIDGSVGWVPGSCVSLTGRTIPAAELEEMLKGGRPDVVQEAMRYLGTPYRYGGRLPSDVDCSLLVQVAFGARGIRLPRTAAAQFEIGQAVNYTELLPGDRLYFVSTSGRINHTGIYVGSGQFLHASSRRRCVAIDALSDRLYWSRFVGARRS